MKWKWNLKCDTIGERWCSPSPRRLPRCCCAVACTGRLTDAEKKWQDNPPLSYTQTHCNPTIPNFYTCSEFLWSIPISVLQIYDLWCRLKIGSNIKEFLPDWIIGTQLLVIFANSRDETSNAVDWPRHRCKLLPSPPGHWHLLSDGSLFANFILTPQLVDVHLAKTNSFSWADVLSQISLRLFFRTSATQMVFDDRLNDKLIQSLTQESGSGNPDAQICLSSFLRRHPFVPRRHLAYDLTIVGCPPRSSWNNNLFTPYLPSHPTSQWSTFISSGEWGEIRRMPQSNIRQANSSAIVSICLKV